MKKKVKQKEIIQKKNESRQEEGDNTKKLAT